MADTFADEYPDIRLWRFRCIVDAGGALLRCRPSAIPDAVILADPFDGWARARLRECVTARRELVAVPVFAFDRPDGIRAAQPQSGVAGVDWRELADATADADIATCARAIARETRGAAGEARQHPEYGPQGRPRHAESPVTLHAWP